MSEKTYFTKNGIQLLKDWNNYTSQLSIATRAAASLLPSLEIIHGDGNRRNVGDLFGLPYTSLSNFAAVWNTNTQARLIGSRLYFNGIALTPNNTPVAIFTEISEQGEELGEVYRVLC